MEALGVRLVVDPATTLRLLGFVGLGVCLGTLSGLLPGIHANNFALFLASVAPSVPGPPTAVGATMIAAGVTHTFLDVVPALALGVPDAAMSVTALPGHRLVIAGRGREALRLSAVGSASAVVLAIPLAIPVTIVMVRIYPAVRANLSVLLATVAVFLILTEPGWHARLGGAVAFVASAGLGLVLLDLTPEAPLDAGGILAPLFAGLFGAPVLVDAIGGAGVPSQADPRLRIGRRAVARAAAGGTVAGAVVGYLPGVSSAIAAAIVLAASPGDGGSRGFIVAVSGVNTANTVFVLFALVALGTPRTGVLVAVDRAGVPLDLPVLLGAVALSAAAASLLVVALGDHYLEAVRSVDYARLSVGILGVLVVVSNLFAGPVGVGAFCASALLGLVPPRVGARRVHLMGVLMGPLILGS